MRQIKRDMFIYAFERGVDLVARAVEWRPQAMKVIAIDERRVCSRRHDRYIAACWSQTSHGFCIHTRFIYKQSSPSFIQGSDISYLQLRMCKIEGSCKSPPSGATQCQNVKVANYNSSYTRHCRDHDSFCRPVTKPVKSSTFSA